jgi:hypothetical protein
MSGRGRCRPCLLSPRAGPRISSRHLVPPRQPANRRPPALPRKRTSGLISGSSTSCISVTWLIQGRSTRRGGASSRITARSLTRLPAKLRQPWRLSRARTAHSRARTGRSRSLGRPARWLIRAPAVRRRPDPRCPRRIRRQLPAFPLLALPLLASNRHLAARPPASGRLLAPARLALLLLPLALLLALLRLASQRSRSRHRRRAPVLRQPRMAA